MRATLISQLPPFGCGMPMPKPTTMPPGVEDVRIAVAVPAGETNVCDVRPNCVTTVVTVSVTGDAGVVVDGVHWDVAAGKALPLFASPPAGRAAMTPVTSNGAAGSADYHRPH